jgi:3-isopropylmalate/(R)-2-methylmalate dehydratase small subunit
MQPFVSHTGRAVPLRRTNVDTDQIIPASYLKRVSRDGFGDGLFAAWREDPSFVINQSRYDGATILVAGWDFATGSSREHAVWALMDYGFKAVIAPRFGDIFRNNATKAGLLPVVLPEKAVVALWEAAEEDPAPAITVDLDAREVRVVREDGSHRGLVASFEIDDYTRWRLMEGLDDIGLTLRHEDAIAAYEGTRPHWLPVTVLSGGTPAPQPSQPPAAHRPAPTGCSPDPHLCPLAAPDLPGMPVSRPGGCPFASQNARDHPGSAVRAGVRGRPLPPARGAASTQSLSRENGLFCVVGVVLATVMWEMRALSHSSDCAVAVASPRPGRARPACRPPPRQGSTGLPSSAPAGLDRPAVLRPGRLDRPAGARFGLGCAPRCGPR